MTAIPPFVPRLRNPEEETRDRIKEIHEKVDRFGMTKRELFAAMAMQGLIGEIQSLYSHHRNQEITDKVTADAVVFADCLIKKLEEK